jgi:preprotein translocase subunit SecY
MNRELARRIAITIGALLLYRLGSHIPFAGLSIQGGVLPPSALARVSIFALNLIPYLTAAIFIQLIAMVWGRLNRLQRSGEAGRRKVARVTLLLTLALASFQSFGIATALQEISGLVPEPGGWFVISTMASMVGGVFFLIWLSELITQHGIGNGLALLLTVGILAALPADIAAVFEVLRMGAISANQVLLHLLIWVAVVAVIVCVEEARRNVPVEFAARQLGARLLPRRSGVLPIKVNSAGALIPATVAPWLWSVPLTIAAFFAGIRQPWIAAAYEHMKFATPAHMLVGSVAVFVLAFVYTAFVLDPEQAADRLREQGGAIPGVEPGEPTADYLDRAVSLTTVLGAAYLTALLLIPEALALYGGGLPYNISGGAVLIVVCTILDIRTQVRGLTLTNPGGVRQ